MKKNLLNELVSESLVDLLNDLESQVIKYYRLFSEYRQVLFNDDFSPMKKMMEDIEKSQSDTVKEMQICIEKIKYDIKNIGILLNKNVYYSEEPTNECNLNLIDIFDTCDNVNTRYHRLYKVNTDVVAQMKDVHKDFIEQMEILNNLLIKYNETSNLKLLTIPEALEAAKNNRPPLLKEFAKSVFEDD
jgi:hypothetical protein